MSTAPNAGEPAGLETSPRSKAILDAREVDVWSASRSFTRRNVLWRCFWQVAWLLLASWTPPPARRWRRAILRSFGARIAEGANVYGSARVWDPRNLSMEANSTLGARVTCYNMAPISIGSYALVSQNAHLCAGTHDFTNRRYQLIAKPITIGHRAWIAADAFVGPGVTVGDGAVLGARGVAAKDLKPWTVYAGNPARALRERPFAD